MSKGTTHRTVRIEDGLWKEAKAKAEAEGVNLSDVIRDALRAYVNEVDTVRAEAWEEGMEAMYATTGSEWPPIPEANPYRS